VGDAFKRLKSVLTEAVTHPKVYINFYERFEEEIVLNPEE